MTRRPHPKLGAAFLHADDAGAGVKAADRAPTAGAPGGQIRLVPGGETGRAFSVVERTARSGSSKTKGSYVSFVAFLTIRAAAWFTSSSASLRFLALAFRAAFAATCSDLRFANSLGIRIESLTAGLRGFMATPSHAIRAAPTLCGFQITPLPHSQGDMGKLIKWRVVPFSLKPLI